MDRGASGARRVSRSRVGRANRTRAMARHVNHYHVAVMGGVPGGAGRCPHLARTGHVKRYDVAVVGGGPAGLAVAITTTARGLSTVVLERATVPADKACGEGLMPPALAVLDALGALALLDRRETHPSWASATCRRTAPRWRGCCPALADSECGAWPWPPPLAREPARWAWSSASARRCCATAAPAKA